jgi:hypothetical protein
VIKKVSYTSASVTTPVEITSYSDSYMLPDSTEDITLAIEVENTGVKNITYSGVNNKFDSAKSVLPTSVTVGKTITVSPSFVAGYGLDSYTFSDETIESTTGEGYSFDFVMPDKDIAITFTTKALPTISLKATDHLTSAKYYSDFECKNQIQYYDAKTSDSIIAVFTTEDGYGITDVSVEGDEEAFVYSSMNSWNISGITINTDIILDVTVVKKQTVSFATVTGLTFALSDETSSFLPGKEVDFTITPDSGYIVATDSVSVKDANGHDVDCSYNKWSKSYSFEMPETAVTVTAGATKLQAAKVTVVNNDTNNAAKTMSFEGDISDASLTAIGSSSSFYIQDTVDFEIDFSDNAWTGAISVKQGDKDAVTIDNEETGNAFINGSFVITEADIIITILPEHKTTRVITTTVDSTIAPSYRINSATAVSFVSGQAIAPTYSNDKITISFAAITDGHRYILTVMNGETKVSTKKSYDGLSYSFTMPDANVSLTLVDQTINYATVTINNNTSNARLTSEIRDSNFVTVGNGGKIEIGTTIRFTSSDKNVNVKVEMGGEVTKNEAYASSFNFTVTADLTVTFTDITTSA